MTVENLSLNAFQEESMSEGVDPSEKGKMVGSTIKICEMIQQNCMLSTLSNGRGEGRVISIRILLWSEESTGGSTKEEA